MAAVDIKAIKPDYPTSTWEPRRSYAICCCLSISVGGAFFSDTLVHLSQ